ncbi:acyl carrier protein [Accumulibacter sp.]|uniref:acyl carrier protein n=1 Tax=Accumulibacter sp. TaxID=2053492 RepID=UPI0025E23D66|nr:phosphopantetheine-binding protein [Accumulibacter sp.]MCM8594619.1 phosphopantetheine-binding protein [Accumulibacter sp.]MCM8627256.1 phosphopantetheine-binding protein [Accumulibacter sp.]MDS4048765.1 phosphopantetheine-binding protein [Accumulibacter sp.]
MNANRQQRREHLQQFLRSIQKPGRSLESIGDDDGLVTSGLIDSLALVQIVLYLEENYGIDFAARGFDPDRLASIASILDLIEESR